MMKLLELLFDSVIGKAVAIGVGFIALLGWWSWEQSGQRAIGAQTERVATERAANANVEKADGVRADADAVARGQRVRPVHPDPYAAARR